MKFLVLTCFLKYHCINVFLDFLSPPAEASFTVTLRIHILGSVDGSYVKITSNTVSTQGAHLWDPDGCGPQCSTPLWSPPSKPFHQENRLHQGEYHFLSPKGHILTL